MNVLESTAQRAGSHLLAFRRQPRPSTQKNWINKAECSSAFVSADGNWYWHWKSNGSKDLLRGLEAVKPEQGGWRRLRRTTELSQSGLLQVRCNSRRWNKWSISKMARNETCVCVCVCVRREQKRKIHFTHSRLLCQKKISSFCYSMDLKT